MLIILNISTNIKRAHTHFKHSAVIYYVGGILLFVTVCCSAGLLLFSYYRHCDPMYSKLINSDDQMFALYVVQSMGHIKGFSGLFLAGVCGAALR